VYRTCWYALHFEDSSIEFRADVNGYNARPREQCIKCTEDKKKYVSEKKTVHTGLLRMRILGMILTKIKMMTESNCA
jgi:hypothetical protein